MRNVPVLTGLAVLWLAGYMLVVRPLWAQSFFSTVSDLPIMAGMSELGGETLFFDKPSGRIVEVAARGQIEPEKAEEFYAVTLPQLGWHASGKGFERNDERLIISYQQAGDHLVVRLSIRPK